MTNHHDKLPLSPREAGQEVLRQHPVVAKSSVRYVSRGRLAVIGKPQKIETVVDRLPQQFIVYLIATDDGAATASKRFQEKDRLVIGGVTDIRVTGWMGEFSISVNQNENTLLLEKHFGLGAQRFDLILDLCEPSVSPTPTTPIGYFAVGSSYKKLADALTALPLCIGDLTKPQYVTIEDNACVHYHNEHVTCRRCLDVCDAWAITSLDHTITFNPYLCQGCGDCATTCPTSAFQYVHPTLKYALSRLQAMLKAYGEQGGKAPSVLLHDGSKGREWIVNHQTDLPINLLPYEIEALGSTGMEFWLMLLALGANQVVLLDAANLESKSQPVVQIQITGAQALLKAMGYPDNLIRWVRPEDIMAAALPVRALMPSEPIVLDSETTDKRLLIRQAVDHLLKGKILAAPVSLPSGSFFGSMRVDPNACTLCLECVGSCPESALVCKENPPRLAFIEANCIQCKGCSDACPENAVTLVPRYLFSPEVHRPRELMVTKPHAPD